MTNSIRIGCIELQYILDCVEKNWYSTAYIKLQKFQFKYGEHERKEICNNVGVKEENILKPKSEWSENIK
ncbi:MAG: hypothetical protein AABY22_14295 [Nanoarchaeota archaeon]